MYRQILSSIVIAGALFGTNAAVAGDTLDAALGGGLGGAAGAAIGNEVAGRNGAIIGGALGGAGGAAISTPDDDQYDHNRYYRHHDHRGGRGCPPGLAKQGRC